MNNDIGLYSLIAAYLYVVIALIISKISGLKKENMIFISAFRMSLQLFLMANILQYVFINPSPFITMIILFIMEAFAIYNIIKRTKVKTNEFKKYITISMATGSLLSIFYFILVIISAKPWYNAQYFITLGGMFIGNTMTAITLAINSFLSEIKSKKSMIQNSLMLGATPKMAIGDIIKVAFNSAITPTMNSMIGMGIVFLPGMMAGQIISGESPLSAIIYQIAIMLGVLGSVTISVYILFNLSKKVIFNNEAQLKLDEFK